MRTATAACIAIVVAALGGCTGEIDVAQHRAPVIYGVDDRQDYYEATDPTFAQLLAEATVALVEPDYIDVSNPNDIVPDTITLGVYQDLCAGERFIDQPAMATCSGSLIDDDLVLTAGHCVDQTVCDEWYFVFGFYMTAAGVLNTMTSADVYTCAEILVQVDTVQGDVWHDYAIVRLDRPVEGNRTPATVHLQPGGVQVGEPITALGFGDGIPGKIHPGATVTQITESWGYFTGSTDTFAGNSGSGTYNDSYEIIGVFVRGSDNDYVNQRGCSVPNTVSESGASQEYEYAYNAVDDLCATGYASARLCNTPDPDGGVEPDPDGGIAPDPDGGITPDPDGATGSDAGVDPDPDTRSGGCQAAGSSPRDLPSLFGFLALLALILLRRRRRAQRRQSR